MSISCIQMSLYFFLKEIQFINSHACNKLSDWEVIDQDLHDQHYLMKKDGNFQVSNTKEIEGFHFTRAKSIIEDEKVSLEVEDDLLPENSLRQFVNTTNRLRNKVINMPEDTTLNAPSLHPKDGVFDSNRLPLVSEPPALDVTTDLIAQPSKNS